MDKEQAECFAAVHSWELAPNWSSIDGRQSSIKRCFEHWPMHANAAAGGGAELGLYCNNTGPPLHGTTTPFATKTKANGRAGFGCPFYPSPSPRAPCAPRLPPPA